MLVYDCKQLTGRTVSHDLVLGFGVIVKMPHILIISLAYNAYGCSGTDARIQSPGYTVNMSEMWRHFASSNAAANVLMRRMICFRIKSLYIVKVKSM